MKSKLKITTVFLIAFAVLICVLAGCAEQGNSPEDGQCVEHSYGEWETVIAATCSAEGSQKRVCQNCKHEETGALTALGHEFDENFTIDVPAKCSEKGSKSKHCIRCGEKTEVTEIDKLGHDEVPHIAKEPTCTEVGWNAYVTCTRCDYSTYEEISAVGHDFEEEFTVDKEATCTASGSKSKHCTLCEEKTEVTELDPLGHNEVNHESKEPTCTEVGWDAYVTCTRCDYSTYEEISAVGHDFEEEFTIDKEATCTESGSKSKHCTRCEEKTEVTELDPLGHNEVNHESKEPTCTEVGWNAYVTCTRCEYTTYEEIEAKGHDEVPHIGQEPTCTEMGWNAYITCTRCQYTTYEEIEAKGHDEVPHIGKEPTCTEVGWNAYVTCTRCQYTTYEGIEAKGHDEVPHIAKEPTCTEVGWNAHVTCTRCDYSTYEEISALGHDFEEEFTVDEEATCTESGSKSKHCTRCEEKTEVTEIEKSGHKFVGGVCQLCGAELPTTVGLKYTLNTDGESYSVAGIGSATDRNIVIATTYEGKPVTAIKDNAFAANNMGLTGKVSIKSVVIPDSVTVVGENVFNNCMLLETVTLGNGIKNIGANMFYNCQKLTSILIPDSVESIDYGAFTRCIKLESIVIPDSVEVIGYNAFIGCSALKEAVIGDGVKVIEFNAFEQTGLTSITLGASVETIGESLFYGCADLKTVIISASVTSIGIKLFADCNSLASVTVDENNTVYHSEGNCIIETESKKLIVGCSTSVIPTDDSVTTIGKYAFWSCGELTSVNIAISVKTIEMGAFMRCVNLTQINYDGTVDGWNGITKNDEWDKGTGDYVVVCSDGTVAKDGTVTRNS